MSEARTTVVVTTRDRADIVLRTVRRLLALEPRPPVIVLDDGSHDDTVERLHSLHSDAPGLRVIRMRGDVPATARNLGVDLARTPFVALCADEVWWAPDALRTAEAAFDAHPELGLVTANVSDPDTAEQDPLCAELAAQQTTVGPLPGSSVLRLHSGASVVRRHAYLHTGGFDPMLHPATEERLLAYDLVARGWHVCYVDGVRAYRHAAEVPHGRVRTRRLALRDELVTTWMRRCRRACVRATARLLVRATHDGSAFLAGLGAWRRFAWAMVERERLPSDVEHRVAAAEHGSTRPPRGS